MLPPNLYARVQLFAKRKQARGTAGAASTRSSLRPLTGRRKVLQQTSGIGCRGIAKPYHAGIARPIPASTRQRNNGESGGGDSSGVQPVNFSSA